MNRKLLFGAGAAVVAMLTLAPPVLAHGDHDARPLARNLEAGPYTVSLWQVYPDAGTAMTPHLIVMLDGGGAAPPASDVSVAVNSTQAAVRPSTTTTGAWETIEGIDTGDVVTVTISSGPEAWDLAPVVVPPAPTSMLPMQELVYISIFLTAATAWWAAGRTARAWRRPVVEAG